MIVDFAPLAPGAPIYSMERRTKQHDPAFALVGMERCERSIRVTYPLGNNRTRPKSGCVPLRALPLDRSDVRVQLANIVVKYANAPLDVDSAWQIENYKPLTISFFSDGKLSFLTIVRHLPLTAQTRDDTPDSDCAPDHCVRLVRLQNQYLARPVLPVFYDKFGVYYPEYESSGTWFTVNFVKMSQVNQITCRAEYTYITSRVRDVRDLTYKLSSCLR